MTTTPVADDWTPIYGCDITSIQPDQLDTATAAARTILFGLSGRRVGLYDTVGEAFTIVGCRGDSTRPIPYKSNDGLWYNAVCGGGCCPLTTRNQPVRSVSEVRSGGVALDAADWFVTGSTVNLTGGCPSCGDCSSPDLEVDYRWGIEPDPLAQMALGEVACELIAGWNGEACRLSTRAVSVSRQGVTVEMLDANELLANGLLGLPMGDAFIRAWNPNHLTSRSRVFSPDLPQPRGG